MNEDNCVLDGSQIGTLADIFYSVANEQEKKGNNITDKLLKLFERIEKLNEMAKQAKDKINHNDYIRHDTAPF